MIYPPGGVEMQIPMKVDYGVRALIDIAKNANGNPIRTNDIAKRASIPEAFLSQVLLALSRQGIIRSQRGPRGGHLLEMDASDISLTMVMECLDEPLTVLGCLTDTYTCVQSPVCVQKDVWRSVKEAVNDILNSTSIEDLARKTTPVSSGRPVFFKN